MNVIGRHRHSCCQHLVSKKLSELMLMSSLFAGLIGLQGCSTLTTVKETLGSVTETISDFGEDGIKMVKGSVPKAETLGFSGPVFDESYPGDMTLGVQAFKNRDYKTALHELYLSAKEGKREAQYYFGVMYARGLGVRQSQRRSEDWLIQSASQGYLDAMLVMSKYYRDGIYYKKDLGESLTWYKKAAKEGSPEAQFIVARSFLVGDFESNINSIIAYKWMRRSAKQNYGAAENGLGMLYYSGDGVEKDYEQAIKYLKRAVSKGDAAASYNLANFYLDSVTGYYNPVEAHALMEQAAITGYQPAVATIGRLERELEAYKNTISLFGLPLGLTNRQEMRERLRTLETTLLMETDDIWMDTYDSSRLMENSDRLYVGYSLMRGRIATVKYRFPEMNTPEGVTSVFDRLYKRYGKPMKNQERDFDISGVYYTWQVKGVHIQLLEGWPKDNLIVNYKVDAVYPQMRDEQKRGAADGQDTGLPINLM